MWRKIIIKSNRIESNAISFECSIECQAYDGTIKLSPNERSLFHRQFGMANVIHKMNKINSEFLSACMCVDGRRNYFLWGKKIVQNVIRFTFFFSHSSISYGMAIIAGPEHGRRTDRDDKDTVCQFICLQ